MATRVAIFGASGYSGIELVRWLSRHPSVEIAGISSDKWAGRRIADAVLGCGSPLAFEPHDVVLTKPADLAFLATPAEVSAALAPKLLDRGVRVVDLSGAFRLRDPASYPLFYGFEHPRPELLAESYYGLPELVGPPDRSVRLVANPGCYATAAALAITPLVRAQLVEPGRAVMLDGKSGTSGAGRKADEAFSFTEVAPTIRPYRVVGHQHVPEIEQTSGVLVSFVPHLVPLARGLIVTAQAPLALGKSLDDVRVAFEAAYAASAFVKVVSGPPELSRTLHTNFAELGFAVDARTRTVIVMAALDNLVKGAAGQAIQNMNAILGIEETTALAALGK